MIQNAEKTPSGKASPEDIAIAVLTWLAHEPDMLSRFLALTGLDLDAMRAMADNAGFHAGLLEFVLAHEPSLEAFCGASNLTPESVEAAWQKLSGPTYGGTGA